MTRYLALTFVLIAAGCAVAPASEDGRPLTLDDAGPRPASADAVIREAIRYRLKDPDSAMFRVIGEPWRMVTNKTMVTNGGAGWDMCFEMNAKNSYGAYTGYKPTYLLWNSGRVIEYLDDDFGEIACRDRKALPMSAAPVQPLKLGIQFVAVDGPVADALKLPSGQGVLVMTVSPGSVADNAGLRQGDVVMRYGEEKIATIEAMQEAVSRTAPGAKVPVSAVRNGNEVLLVLQF